jgi:hypothetical protein
MKSTVERLSAWYAARCDGVWEHANGFEISTLDNPGVSLNVDLQGTYLEAVPFDEQKEYAVSDDRWLVCRRTSNRFEGRGAPTRLDDIIRRFLDWAEQNEK